jgi:hypothetical protein
MAISTLFFIFLAVCIVGVIAAVLNIWHGATKAFEQGFGGIKGTFAIHLVCGLLYVLGGLGALITGIIWLVQTLKA